LRVGGYTFAEDPELDCIHVAPLWSAAVDPHVLSAVSTATGIPPTVDLLRFDARIIQGETCQHVHLAVGGDTFRLDATGDTLTHGPVQFTYLLVQDGRLSRQIETIRRLDEWLAGGHPKLVRTSSRISRLSAALRARDARSTGASLRNIADEMLGSGAWPGPGECRKSAARRLVAIGEQLVADGPRPILAW